MTLGWNILELLDADIARVAESRVDCGTCPVSLQCALSVGNNGWRWDCCGASAIEFEGTDERALLILDCARNTFPSARSTDEIWVCPLCSGDVVKDAVSVLTPNMRYVPTVHAKVPLDARALVWRRVLPEAVAIKREVDERRARCRTPRE